LRYAIISDIHSNLEALTTVLTHIENNKVDNILCLGDIVGYGPNPNECVELVKSNCSIIIAGNHDVACIDISEAKYFNSFAKQAIFWTGENLWDSSRSFISQLPLHEEIENVYLVHASPDNPADWNYVSSSVEAKFSFLYFSNQICFIGHSHVPLIYVKTDDNKVIEKKKDYLTIESNERYLINIGSVGQPRDNNPDAAYAILDTDKKEYQLVRLPYDYEETQQKMLEQKLPSFLIERLRNGR